MTLEQKIVVGFWVCILTIIVGVVLSAYAKLLSMFGIPVGAIVALVLVPVAFVGAIAFSLWAFFH